MSNAIMKTLTLVVALFSLSTFATEVESISLKQAASEIRGLYGDSTSFWGEGEECSSAVTIASNKITFRLAYNLGEYESEELRVIHAVNGKVAKITNNDRRNKVTYAELSSASENEVDHDTFVSLIMNRNHKLTVGWSFGHCTQR